MAMEQLALVDLRQPGYGIQLQFRSESPARHQDFLDVFNRANRAHGVVVWGKQSENYSGMELLTENQDTILDLALDVAERLTVELSIL